MLADRAPPVKTCDRRFLNFQSIHQFDDVHRDRRLLAIAWRVASEESGRTITAHIRNDHAVAGLRQQRRDLDKTVNLVGPAVQKNSGSAISRTNVGVSYTEWAGSDLF